LDRLLKVKLSGRALVVLDGAPPGALIMTELFIRVDEERARAVEARWLAVGCRDDEHFAQMVALQCSEGKHRKN
jgi:hypothetical protein